MRIHMNITENAKNYQNKFGGEDVFGIYGTDPEYAERVTNFAFDEVVNHDDLDDKSRFMAILATLMGCQGIDAFKDILPYAAKVLSPVEIKETAYQATDYLGIGRALPFVKAVNAFLEKENTALPLEPQATTTMETRLEAGVQAQVDIFGDGMKEFYKSGAEESRHINRWLAANCFGDYYTRKGLDLKQREMITFCFLSAQGGCEPQLTSHAAANLRIGNDKAYMIKIISQCLPYIGYPRSLNALRCLNDAAAK